MTTERLSAVVRRFGAAVTDLVDPHVSPQKSTLLPEPGLYYQLVREVALGKSAPGVVTGRASFARRVPIWLDAVDLRMKIDRTVHFWSPDGGQTPHRLRTLAHLDWRPDHAEILKYWAECVESWAVDIKLLLDPPRVKFINVDAVHPLLHQQPRAVPIIARDPVHDRDG